MAFRGGSGAAYTRQIQEDKERAGGVSPSGPVSLSRAALSGAPRPISGSPSSRNPFNAALASDGPIARRGWIGALLTSGNPSQGEIEARRFSGPQQAAAEYIRTKVDEGLSPQRAMMDFIGTTAGTEFFASGGDLADLANIGSLAVEPQPETTAGIREYEYARGQGYTGSFEDFLASQKSGTTVNVEAPGLPPDDAELRKSLDKQTAEQWGGFLKAGDTAAAMIGDLDVIDELITVAPQGPLTGRLAEAFPGVDSAADAFNSIVKRLAPQMRVEGSGSTSDIEFDAFLRAMPALRNRPEANRLIARILREKSVINLDRAAAIMSYQDGELTAAETRDFLRELDRKSIMTPELKRLITGVGGKTPASDVPDSFMPNAPDRSELWQQVDPADRELWQ